MNDTTPAHGKNWDTAAGDAADRISPWAWLANGVGTRADRQNHLRITAWSIAWVVAILIAGSVLRGELGPTVEGNLVWMIAAAPNLVALGVIRAYLRFFRETDELVRLIQLQSMALGFTVWFFVFVAWELFIQAGANPLFYDAAIIVPLLSGFFGQFFFAWRYR
tara:strand:+ start:187 stop:678 length:492 start_codon:yes stop_codon:yes gene_type:complete